MYVRAFHFPRPPAPARLRRGKAELLLMCIITHLEAGERERESESCFQNVFLTTRNDFGSFQDNQPANSTLISDKL